MKSELGTSNRKASPLVITAVAMLLLVTAYFGAYFANIKNRVAVPPMFGSRRDDQPKFNFYRIGQEQSEVIFWAAEQVDAVIRP